MKKNHLKTICIVLMLAVFAFAACDPVEDNLKRMDRLVADAEANASSYTGEDWETFVDQFQICQEALDKSKREMTPEDHRQYGSISARFQKLMLSHAMDIIKSDLEAGMNFLDGYMDEMDELTQGMDDTFEEAAEEME